MKLSKKRESLLKRIMGEVPNDACYSLNVVRISGNGWTETLSSDQFIEDYPSMNKLDCLEEIQRKHPGDPCWSVQSKAFEIGNPDVGSDPIPDHLLALAKEFGLGVFSTLPELRRIDRASFEFDIRDSLTDERMSPETPLTREHIVIDRDLIIEDDGINAYIETWFDVNGKFAVDKRYNDDKTVNFYAVYHPGNDSLKCVVVIRSDDKSREIKYSPLPEEVTLIKAMMEEMCLKENGCDLSGLWAQRDD